MKKVVVSLAKTIVNIAPLCYNVGWIYYKIVYNRKVGEAMSKRVSVSVDGLEYNYTYDKSAPSDLDLKHCHDTYEILFVVSGEGKYVVEGSYFDIHPVTLMVVRPFEFHSVMLDNEIPYERYVLRFSLSALVDAARERFLSFMDTDSDGAGKYFSSARISREIFSIFDRFEFALSLPELVRADYARLLLSELVLFLCATGGEAMPHSEEELGARVIRYLNENIHRNISLDKLARRFFVSKYHLCRAFKKHNGISVHGYINQKRVMYAKQLIDEGETASGAAYRVGFGDYSSFYRAYVKVLGKSPTAD